MNRLQMFSVIRVGILMVLSSALCAQERVENEITIQHTKTGVRFGMLGKNGPSPAPTLFMFGDTIEGTLTREDFSSIARVVGKNGYLCVSLDLPCHGMEAKSDDPPDRLSCWRKLLEEDDNFVGSFVPKVSAVLDFSDRAKLHGS